MDDFHEQLTTTAPTTDQIRTLLRDAQDAIASILMQLEAHTGCKVETYLTVYRPTAGVMSVDVNLRVVG